MQYIPAEDQACSVVPVRAYPLSYHARLEFTASYFPHLAPLCREALACLGLLCKSPGCPYAQGP